MLIRKAALQLNVTVRAVHAHELLELLELYQHLNDDDPFLEPSHNIIQLWHNILEDPNTYLLVAEHESRIVSTCMLNIINNLTRNARPFAIIENVVTHMEYRGNGYGKLVINGAKEVAKEHNCYKIMLLTGRKNREVIHFYESIGFIQNKKIGLIYEMK